MPWLSRFDPTPGFPAYTGPYQVGTVDVEVPAADLPPQAASPESAPSTISFRIFYPCEEPTAPTRPVRWIPSPQRPTVSAAARFLGANSKFAEVFALFPSLLYYITIPAHRNAPILQPPTSSKRWPVMVFSHGLAGSRNMYSHICGSVASHGMVVIAMDHRDGSSPIQFIRATKSTDAQVVEPVHLSHTPSPEVWEGRDKQLRIRLWELAMAHTALLKIDRGQELENLDDNTSHDRKERIEVLDRFTNMLDIHEPGKINFAGHSFGACTTIQFLKSVFYRDQTLSDASQALFNPFPDAEITKQITPQTPIALLDLWCLPLRSPDQSWLWERPLPAYAPGGPGGKAILSILSQGFFNWTGNCNDTKRAISAPENYSGANPEPYCFYPANSQHFSQSDFGILFPWITKRLMKAMEPERLLTLNMRAVLQMLRENGVEVAETSKEDMEISTPEDEQVHEKQSRRDPILLDHGNVRGWIRMPTTDKVPRASMHVEEDQKEKPVDELPQGFSAAMEM